MNKYKIVMNNETSATLDSKLKLEDFVASLKGTEWINMVDLGLAIQVCNISTIHLVKE